MRRPRTAVGPDHGAEPMPRRKLSTRRPGVLVVLSAPGVTPLPTGCGTEGTGKTAPGQAGASRTRTSAPARSPGPDATPDGSPRCLALPRPAGDGLPGEPATDASAQVEEALRAARAVALRSNPRHIDPAERVGAARPQVRQRCTGGDSGAGEVGPGATRDLGAGRTHRGRPVNPAEPVPPCVAVAEPVAHVSCDRVSQLAIGYFTWPRPPRHPASSRLVEAGRRVRPSLCRP